MRLADDGHGDPAASLAFFRDHRHHLGAVLDALISPYRPNRYSLLLRDADGNELRLSGTSCGDASERTRIAMLVLVECGFPADTAAAVFTNPRLRFSRGEDAQRARLATHQRAPRRRRVTTRAHDVGGAGHLRALP